MPVRTYRGLIDALKALKTNGGSTNATAIDGGVVEIDGEIVTPKPILLNGGVGIRGTRSGSRIVYGGTDVAVQYHTPLGNGLCDAPMLADLMIHAPNGRGVACDSTVKSLNMALISNVIFNTAGASLDFPKLADNNYDMRLRDIRIAGTPKDGRAVNVVGVQMDISNLEVVNIQGKGDTPIVEFNGTGTIDRPWIEPFGAGGVAMKLTGNWDIRSPWLETHVVGVPQLILEGGAFSANYLYAFTAEAWLELRNSFLDVASVIEHRNDPAAIRVLNSSVRTRAGELAAVTPMTDK